MPKIKKDLDKVPETNDPKFPNFEFQSLKDILYPLIFIILILILAYFIWTLISPVLSVAISGLIAYFAYLRRLFGGKK